MARTRLGAVAVMATLAGGLMTGAAGGPSAHAALDPGSHYKISARADAMAIEYLNTAAPVFAEEPIIYGTPATAISALDSVGQSNALAAAPYPGDVMIGMPDNGKGVIAGFGGPSDLFPTYPFAVASSHPIKPDAVQDQSGNRLVAHSEQHASRSDARSGLITGDVLAALQAQASSAVSADETTGKLTAVADSRLDAFKLTDMLQIGRSTAHAKIIREAGQAAVKESAFTIGSIVVNGTTISYSDQGFQVGDQSPGEEPPAALFEPLKAAGITVEFIPAADSESSIESAGLRITQVQAMGAATQRVSFVIGHVSARIDGEAVPAADGLLDDSLPASEPSDPAGATGSPAGSEPIVDGPAEASAGGEALSGYGSGLDAGGLGLTASTSSVLPALPDLSTLPPALEAAAGSPTQTAPAPRVTPSPSGDVRLASPASVGRGLRDDDVTGLYAALGAATALIALAGFLLPGLGRRRAPAPARSVLRLP